VIGREEAVGEAGFGHDDAQLLEQIEGAGQDEGPGAGLLVKRRARDDHDGQDPGEVRVDIGEDARRVAGVLPAHRDAADPEENRHGKRDPRLLDAPGRLDDAVGRRALADFREDRLVAGFDAQVDDPEPPLLQLAELPDGFFPDALRVGVGADATHAGQMDADRVEDPDQAPLRDDEGVPVAQEDPVDPSEPPGGVCQVFPDLVEAPDAEALALEARAEGAPVVRAADGDLEQQAVRLAGGADDVAFVPHHAPWLPP